MNRIIKFRAWDKTNNRMLYPVDIFNSQDLWWADTPNGCLQFERILNSHGHREILPIQQFTGLLDKNDKEIYEGDIVKLGYTKNNIEKEVYFNCRVCWSNRYAGWGFPLIGPQRKSGAFDGDAMDYINTLEVVGNIFEHPELLEETKV